MAELHSAGIRTKLRGMGDYIMDDCKLEHPERRRDWRTYERRFARLVSAAMVMLDPHPLIHEAVNADHTGHRAGHPRSLTLKRRVKLPLIKRLVGVSNGMFSNTLAVFIFHAVRHKGVAQNS